MVWQLANWNIENGYVNFVVEWNKKSYEAISSITNFWFGKFKVEHLSKDINLILWFGKCDLRQNCPTLMYNKRENGQQKGEHTIAY